MGTAVIQSVKLQNFRCHESYLLDCSKETTLILGENGCGKTSVLEAIYIALQGKSFRADDGEILQRGKSSYRIEVLRQDGGKIGVNFSNGSKTFLIKDRSFSRLPMKEKYPVILFLPEDLNLVTSYPSTKRTYFDRMITQLDGNYAGILTNYQKALRQRNTLLKQENVTEEMLFPWSVLLAKYGVKIRKLRQWLANGIDSHLTETYHSIAENNDRIGLNYISHTGTLSENDYFKVLSDDFEKDKITGHTNFGAHKDNYEFVFNGSLANGSASRGETRSIILALKFIEAEEAQKVLGVKPVVLLDDVFSELDKTRQRSLVTNFKNNQVILTSVDGVRGA